MAVVCIRLADALILELMGRLDADHSEGPGGLIPETDHVVWLVILSTTGRPSLGFSDIG